MKFTKKSKLVTIIVIAMAVLAAGIIPMVVKTTASGGKANQLKIYITECAGKETPSLSRIISVYQKEYPNIKIQKIAFDVNNEGYNKYNQRLLDDTLSGSGPDVLLLDPTSEDVYKLEKSGVLEDLKPYLTKDKSFSRNDYNVKVLDTGIFDGKQLLLPVNYRVYGYLTAKELLAQSHISLPANGELSDFMATLSPYIATVTNNKDKNLFAFPISISDFLNASGFSGIDYEHKKAQFDTPEFRTLMDDYKKIYLSTPKASDFQGVSGEEGMNALIKGTALFSTDMYYLQMPDFLLKSESMLKDLTGQTQVAGFMPTAAGGNQPVAVEGDCFAINSASKNKDAAYNFIRIALSDSYQSTVAGYEGFPVKKSAAEEIKNNYLSNEVGKTDQDRHKAIRFESPSQNLGQYYDTAVNSVSNCSVYNSTIEQMFKDCMTPFFEDKETFDSALKSLDNKVNLYLNE